MIYGYIMVFVVFLSRGLTCMKQSPLDMELI